MKRSIGVAIALLGIGPLVVGCDVNPHLSVSFMKDGEVAAITHQGGNGEYGKTYRIKCGEEDQGKYPFGWEWEEDCDLNTIFNGRVQDWDNPDERDPEDFEDRRQTTFDDDEGDSLGLEEFAVGAVVGSLLSKKEKPVKKDKRYVKFVKPTFKPKTVTKPQRKTAYASRPRVTKRK